MLKFLRWTAIVLGVAFLLTGAAGFGVYKAATALPKEYAAALEVDTQQLEEQRQELESQIAALYSDSQAPVEPEERQRWEATVTDAQINGWLATRLAQEFPEAEKQGILAPRVLFEEDGLTLAFRVSKGRIDAVVMFQVSPFVTEDDELGIELTGASIGKMPLPPGRIVELSRPFFEDAGLPIRWSHVEGQPTMLVDFERLASDVRNRRSISDIRYGEGRLYVAGETERQTPKLAQRTARDADK